MKKYKERKTSKEEKTSHENKERTYSNIVNFHSSSKTRHVSCYYQIAFVIANVCCYVLGQFDDYTLDSQHNGVGRRVSSQHRNRKRGNGAAASTAGLMGPSDLDYNYQQENTFYDDINLNYYQEGVDLLPSENKIRLQRHHIHDYEPQSHQHV